MTLLALTVGDLLAGAVVVETVFNMTGVGMITQQSVRDQDTPVVMAVVVLVSTIYVLVNLVTDLLYPVIDRRISVAPVRRTRRWYAGWATAGPQAVQEGRPEGGDGMTAAVPDALLGPDRDPDRGAAHHRATQAGGS